ncbi:methylitaconate delta2-delta3-isomerase [Sporothrix schenckii 1099-18]|uniref:Methylitaconate delta2-delta3-isomerase n=1 Tax=Sporothrix schenckii 1099-18 TaxID=1397361 RepID=A0A0F2MI26_SPOSC|nr:methylitaconate delta2-delta3-isomerase [Sporothrix schenckii 1099-18]KJR87831.1 methylitaconate delta2-delta3-isomerase [Sporothrix schenckii 1099-18]
MADRLAQRLLARLRPPGRQAASARRSHARLSSSSSRLPPHERSFPAYFVRGGTSNGLVIREDVLPAFDDAHDCRRGNAASAADGMRARAAAWTPVLVPAMGSPDPQHGRQLDGMGSGVSSTSKICVIAPPANDAERADRDVNFTFVQVGVRDGRLDLAGNCGNMISAVGPLAFDLGYCDTTTTADDDGSKEGVVRIFNTNTNKLIRSRFRVAGDPPRFCPDGDYAMDGVPGTHSRITMSFIRPAGAKTGAQNGLPTGQAVDMLSRRPGAKPSIPASLVDVSNPGVFVLGSSLGLAEATTEDGNQQVTLDEVATAIETDTDLKATVDHLRREGACRMGMDPDTESVPKIVILFPPSTAAGETTTDIRCVALSMGQVHKAVPLTLALCLGAASRIPGTLAEQLVAQAQQNPTSASEGGSGTIVIGHPSGRVEVGTTLDETDGTVLSAELHRTARVMMEGKVFY